MWCLGVGVYGLGFRVIEDKQTSYLDSDIQAKCVSKHLRTVKDIYGTFKGLQIPNKAPLSLSLSLSLYLIWFRV